MKDCKECLEIVFRRALEDTEYDIGMYEEMKLLALINEINEPLKTKEVEKYNRLLKEKKKLARCLNE